MSRWVLLIFLLIGGRAAAELPARFGTPASSDEVTSSLAKLRLEVGSGQLADGAARLDGLLREHGTELAAIEDRWLVSPAAIVEALAPGQRNALTEAYRKQFDDAAREALSGLEGKQHSSAEEFHALARQFPLSTAAAQAYSAAGERALRMGDVETAGWFFQKAGREGRAQRGAASGPGGWNGPAPIDATWYGRPEAVGNARSFPYYAGGLYYLAGPQVLLAMKENGKLAWRFASPEAWTRSYAADRAASAGRGPSFEVSAFSSPGGPQILVVRQPRGTTRHFLLRALRASDGKPLWSTAQAELEQVSIVSGAAIAGRYLYTVGVDASGGSTVLVLLGLDLLDGRLLFKSKLGQLLGYANRDERRGWDELSNQSAPAIAGDAVIVTPNVGVAFSVDRFTGALRWLREYEAPGHGPVSRGRGRDAGRAESSAAAGPPGSAVELLRYRGTPHIAGDVVVIAPQDTPFAYGLDLATGRQVWSNTELTAPTLVGGSGAVAVFAGSLMVGLDAKTGISTWQVSPRPPGRITGPAVVRGGWVHVPTTEARPMVISVDTGRLEAAAARAPNLRGLLTNEAVRKTLDDAMILRSIGLPAVGR